MDVKGWPETRNAILSALIERGHEIILLSQLSEGTYPDSCLTEGEYDILMLEFGSANTLMFAKAWEASLKLVKEHKGPIIYINDDPDLHWSKSQSEKLFQDEDWSRWTFAFNAIDLSAVRKMFHIPTEAKVVEFPMKSLFKRLPFADGEIDKAIYYGKPKAREKMIQAFYTTKRLAIAGVQKQYEPLGLSVLPVPEFNNRGFLYRQYWASLALFDSRHAKIGFRTGRAYHSVLNGVPALAPVGNEGLGWVNQLRGLEDFLGFFDESREYRRALLEQQQRDAFPDVDWESLSL